MAEHTLFEMVKNFALVNIPFLMKNGTKVYNEGKKKVTEYSLKQKINNDYKKIGQLIYKNKIKINNKNIKHELETIASYYLDLQNNNDIIDSIKKD